MDALEAILALSRAVAEKTDVTDLLDAVASTSVTLVQAGGAAIVLRPAGSETGLAVAAAYGLSGRYTHFLNRIEPVKVGEGLSGTAIARREPVLVADVLTDPIVAAWRPILVEEGYRSAIAVPLSPADGAVLGVLNVYRRRPGKWAKRDVKLLAGLADHAAIAIRIARLLAEQVVQVESLSLIVGSLRSQAHEHSNRLHLIQGLLALGEVESAMRVISDVEDGYRTASDRVSRRIANPALAGFLVSEQAIARQSGIDLRIDPRSRLDELPLTLTDLDAVTIVGNLIHNAIDAVADLPEGRIRRVSVAILQEPDHLLFRIRDWGCGASPQAITQMFTNGFSLKPGHPGIGLSLVHRVVHTAGGSIAVERAKPGLVVIVTVPR